MHAAVVTSFDRPPQYGDYPTPVPNGPHQVLVEVLAAGLHPRVRSQANGLHYTSTDELPLVPGIDGVGRAPDGSLRYFVLPDTSMGSMAEQTVVDLRRSVVLPAGSDAVRIAAAMNPAMSSWLALRRRISFEPGQHVLILGATGNAGQLAVQIAKHFGAAHVIGAGRQADRLAGLAALGADETISLAGDPGEVADRIGRAAADVDVVIDYLWGSPAVVAMSAIAASRAVAERPLTWIQIGAVAGPTAAIPSAALRAVRLAVVGSGQGSIPTADIVSELPELAAVIDGGGFEINAHSVALAEIAAAWADTASDRRLVVIP